MGTPTPMFRGFRASYNESQLPSKNLERESLVQFQTEVNPENHGWFVDECNDQLDIKWMKCNPAPDEV